MRDHHLCSAHRRIRQELLHSRGYDVMVRQNGLQSLFCNVLNTGWTTGAGG
jgi:hypothetical protein